MSDKYRILNWDKYNQALVNRGSLDFWLNPKEVKEKWFSKTRGRPGRQEFYSDYAIQTVLTLGLVFGQRLRQLEGFACSLFRLFQLDLPVPDYTTLCRRGGKLKVSLPKLSKGKVTLLLDSTGLKVFGEGEWKVRQHGFSKRRTWRKLHLGIDPDGEIRSELLTENSCHDAHAGAELLTQEQSRIQGCFADGMYDTQDIYHLLDHLNVKQAAIPPRKNARLRVNSPPLRRKAILTIRASSRKKWKRKSGYHLRSNVETAMFRRKIIFGDKLHAKKMPQQETEALLSCAALNRMLRLGMPKSVKAA